MCPGPAPSLTEMFQNLLAATQKEVKLAQLKMVAEKIRRTLVSI